MNANQLNAHFRKLGIAARIIWGSGYYYWADERGQLLVDAESVYVFRAGELPLESWVALARDAANTEACR